MSGKYLVEKLERINLRFNCYEIFEVFYKFLFLIPQGSKRMSDAEVQTDPVSILPAGKSK